MTTIIYDGQTYLAYACTAIPSPAEVEYFDLPSAERQPAVLLYFGEDHSKSVISWHDPSALIGRGIINDEASDADRDLAFGVVIDRYGLSDSDAILTAEVNE